MPKPGESAQVRRIFHLLQSFYLRLRKMDRLTIIQKGALLLTGFLLPFAVFFEYSSPFAVAFYAVARKGGRDTPLFAMAVLGYMVRGGSIFQYLLALVILYGFKSAYRRREEPNHYILPLVCAISILFSGGLLVALLGFLKYDLMILFFEVVLVSGAAFMFSIASDKLFFSPAPLFRLNIQEQISFLALVSACLLALGALTVSDFSIGRMVGVFLLLAIAQSGNIQAAAVAAILFGLIFGIGGDRSMLLCAAYGGGALFSSILRPLGRIVTALSFTLTAGAILFYGTQSEMSLIFLFEILAAAILSLFIPKNAYKRVHSVFSETAPAPAAAHETRLRKYLSGRLLDLSTGYKDVFELVGTLSGKLQKLESPKVGHLVDSVSNDICKKCKTGHICWGKEYNYSYELMSKATLAMLETGKLTGGQMPTDLSVRCISPQKLIDSFNRNFDKMKLHQHVSEQLKIQRGNQASQFTSLSSAMERLSLELQKNISFDEEGERRLLEFLTEQNIPALSVVVMYNEFSRARVEITLQKDIEEQLSDDQLLLHASRLLRTSLSQLTRESGPPLKIILTNRAGLRAQYSVRSMAKTGEQISGDFNSAFTTDFSGTVFLICDGMGSGKRAAVDAQMAVRVIERILKAGFNPDMAFNCLSSALSLSSDDERVLAADLTCLDLYSGRMEFYKAGSAPSYLKRRGSVKRIHSKSIPIGILNSSPPVPSVIEGLSGDILVMVSDGAVFPGDEQLMSVLQKDESGDPSVICDMIIRSLKLSLKDGLPDDVTVMVIALS